MAQALKSTLQQAKKKKKEETVTTPQDNERAIEYLAMQVNRIAKATESIARKNYEQNEDEIYALMDISSNLQSYFNVGE